MGLHTFTMKVNQFADLVSFRISYQSIPHQLEPTLDERRICQANESAKNESGQEAESKTSHRIPSDSTTLRW